MIGFPGGSEGKESICNAGNSDSIPGWGRYPGEGNGYPVQYSCLENFMDRGDWWVGYSPWGHKESVMTEQVILSLFTFRQWYMLCGVWGLRGIYVIGLEELLIWKDWAENLSKVVEFENRSRRWMWKLLKARSYRTLGYDKDLGFYSIGNLKDWKISEGMISFYYVLKGHSGFCEENKLSGKKEGQVRWLPL